MFEIGPSELLLVCVIGLLVLGPKRLPKVAAEIGKWVGRARRTASHLRRQLEREVELSELEMREPPPKPPAPPPPATSQAAGAASTEPQTPAVKGNGATDPSAHAVQDDGHTIGEHVEPPQPAAGTDEPAKPEP
jgi:sec-independent protein translocase protein TatB